MTRLRITSLLLVAGLATAPVAAQDDGGTSREQAALSEEQELLRRQLQRLEGSMESLAERFEAEGRVHAAGLLRRGLSHVGERDQSESSNLTELMESATSELRGGRVHQSLEQMEVTVARLERLLTILLDRPDVDELEERLEELQAFQRALGEMASEEGIDPQRLKDGIAAMDAAFGTAGDSSSSGTLVFSVPPLAGEQRLTARVATRSRGPWFQLVPG